MVPFPLRASLGGGVCACVSEPYATLVLVATSPRAALCLSPAEQDRLRLLIEAGRRCDEILDPDEDAANRVRCIRAGGTLTLIQDGAQVAARGPAAIASLLDVLRANTYGVEDGIWR